MDRIHNGITCSVDNTEHRGILPVVNNTRDKFVKQVRLLSRVAGSRLHRGGLLAARTTKREATMRMRLIFANIASSCLVFLAALSKREKGTRRKRGTKTLVKENETKGSLRVRGSRLRGRRRRELVKFEAVWVFRDAGHKSL